MKLDLAALKAKFPKYRKFAVTAAGVVAVVAQAYSDGHITPDEWVNIGIAVVTAYGVWQLPNKQPFVPSATVAYPPEARSTPPTV